MTNDIAENHQDKEGSDENGGAPCDAPLIIRIPTCPDDSGIFSEVTCENENVFLFNKVRDSNIDNLMTNDITENHQDKEESDENGGAPCDSPLIIRIPTCPDDSRVVSEIIRDNEDDPVVYSFPQGTSSSSSEMRDPIFRASNDLVGGLENSHRLGRLPASSLNSLRQFPRNYNDATLLLDVHPDHYGIFTGITPSITFIPDKYVKRTRNVWNSRMQKCLDDNSEEDWKKLLLLPIVLFDCEQNVSLNERKRNLGVKLDLLKNDDWSAFRLGSLSKRTLKSGPMTQEQIHSSATRLAEVGEIGKAFKKLKSDRNRVVPSQEVLHKLQSKFPEAGVSSLTPEQIESIFNYNPEANDESELIIATTAEIEVIIMKARKQVAHGIDHLRYEQLNQLWSPYSNDPTDGEFRRLLTGVINKIIQAQIPPAVVAIFRDIELLALPKGDDDVRPIGLQLILKKIACSICLNRTKTFNKDYFKSLQYCMSPFGTESVSLFFRAILESRPDLDLWAKDGDNGFGRLSRISGLYETKEKFPAILPILRMIYGSNANAWYMGLDDGIESVKSSEGCQQGDVLSMWYYAMAIHPFLQKIRDALGNNGFSKWYADDGNTVAPFNKMIEVIRIVKEEGPKVGYFIKFSKGTYLLGKCDTHEEAIIRKNTLVGFGLNEETIHLHPDNDPENADKFGCNILGSWVGSTGYIHSHLEEKLAKLQSEAEAIKNYPNKQVQHLILRWCFSQKINHLQRSIPPELLENFVNNFDFQKRDIFESILGYRVTDSIWTQCCLTTSDGGMGYQDVRRISHSAYLASIFQCSSILKEISPDIFESNLPMIQSFNKSLTQNALLSGSDRPLIYEDLITLQNQATAKRETLQSKLFEMQRSHTVEMFRNSIRDTKRLAWIVSISGSDSKSSRWLDVTPKTQDFKFKSDEFQVLLCHRLLLQQPVYVPTSKCYCKSAPLLDPYGHHLSAGCAKEGTFHKTHDSLKFLVKDMCNFAGFVTRVEETRCFQEAYPNSKLRPDLSIYSYPIYPQRKMIIDVSFTHPVPITSKKVLSKNHALQSCRAANLCYRRKVNKYGAISEANNLEFLPLIFETTGKMHPKTETFLDRTLTEINKRRDPVVSSALNFYWYSRVSCCIQKCIADAILTKSRNVNGNLIHSRNWYFIENFLANNALSVSS